MKNFMEDIEKRVLLYDGSKGYMLQTMGLKGGECAEVWNIQHEDKVKEIYRMYRDAGSDVIQSNTFQGSRLQLEKYSLGNRVYELNYKSVKLAKEVMGTKGYVAASIGPLGLIFEPLGDLDFDTAYKTFKEQVEAVVDAGADLIHFETFTDIAEIRAALIAARDTADKPVICSLAFEANGKTLMGTDPFTAAIILDASGASIAGTNCSFGPEQQVEIIKKMNEAKVGCLVAKPNAGLPCMVDGTAVYSGTPENFTSLIPEFVNSGVRLMGGCCGTTPEHIKAMKDLVKGIKPPICQKETKNILASAFKSVNPKEDNLDIGFFNASSIDKGISDVIDRAQELACEGHNIIVIDLDNTMNFNEQGAELVNTAQTYIREPFVFITKDAALLGRVLRIYRGKAGIFTGSLREEVRYSLLKAAKEYNCIEIEKIK